MSKYYAVAKIMFKAQLIYRFDVMFTIVGTVWRMVFAWVLWGAVFAGRETVGGFTFQEMLSYYIVSSFLVSIEMSGEVSNEISARIRGGTFSKYMVIPVNPQAYFLSQTLGKVGYYTFFSVIAAIFCTLVFGVKLSLSADPAVILCAVAMVLTGLAFMVCYQFFIGLLALKFQDIGFFTIIQENLLAFLTGAIIPLSLLPAAAFHFLRFLPFTYVTYTPAMLLTGQIGIGEGVFGLGVLAVWLMGLIMVGRLTYKRLRIKFDGVGI